MAHHANTEQPKKCLIRLFKKYCEHRPEGVDDIFYLTPIQQPKGNVWYKKSPIGENTLSKTIKRLCDAAGIVGHKSNHSLRVTAATRLFHKGIDEQLIMERTGHKNLDGVRAYKRTSERQQEMLSSVLNGGGCFPPTKNIKADHAPLPASKNTTIEIPDSSHDTTSEVIVLPDSPQVKEIAPPDQSQGTGREIERSDANACKENMSPPMVNFSGCNSITVNYYFK